MPEDQSLISYKEGKDAQQKFDAFLVSICGILFAYIAQTYVPRKLAFDPSIFDPLALVFLTVSFFSGLKRMESVMQCSMLNFHLLDFGKKIGGLMEILTSGKTDGFFKNSGETLSVSQLPDQIASYENQRSKARIQFDRSAAKAKRYYQVRNMFLLLGFGSIFLSKLLSPYFAPTTPPKALPQPTPPVQPSQPPALSPTHPK